MRRLTALVLATLPLPAAAQESICGGIAQVGEWFGGSESASDPTAGGPLDTQGTVPIAGHLVRIFTLAEGADVRIEAAAIGGGDPYLTVVGADGTEVAEDDDSGGDLSARAETTLEPGTYCVAARSYSGGLTEVSMRVGLLDQPALTQGVSQVGSPPVGPGCDAPEVGRLGDDLTAADLAAGVSLSGSASEAPGRAFTLAEPVPLTLTATGTQADPVIRLLDGTGAQLAENDDADGLNSRIDMIAPMQSGVYCIEVEDLNESGDAIEVTLRNYDAAGDRRERLDLAEIAPGPQDDIGVAELGAIQTSIIHDIEAGGRAGWMRFTLPEGGLLVAEAIAGGGVDPKLKLFDRAGRVVAENDDGPEGLDSFIASRLVAGEYLLALQLVDETTSGPVRILLERFVPAQ